MRYFVYRLTVYDGLDIYEHDDSFRIIYSKQPEGTKVNSLKRCAKSGMQGDLYDWMRDKGPNNIISRQVNVAGYAAKSLGQAKEFKLVEDKAYIKQLKKQHQDEFIHLENEAKEFSPHEKISDEVQQLKDVNELNLQKITEKLRILNTI